MAHSKAQHILQAGLAAGMSATEGIHSSKPKPMDPSFPDLEHVLPHDFIPTNSTRVTFRGKHGDIQVPYMAWGAWSWGDKATWQWSDAELPALQEAWKLCVKEGMTFVDNAQAYGSGKAEEIHGDLLKGIPREKVFIQTKWYVVPDNATNLFSPSKAPAKMLKESLSRYGVQSIDCYLVHGPIHASSISQAAKGLAECVDSGMTKTVGVANYSLEDMLKMRDELAKYDIPLATNQCEYSILRRLPEARGLLKACKENGIVFQSYSSLAQGRLTGKYTKDNPPPKERRFSSIPMEEVEHVLEVTGDIAKAHNVSMSAVALNYNMSKGVLPVVGIRRPQQVEQNMQALGWRLSDDEIKKIDSVSLKGKATKLWQQG